MVVSRVGPVLIVEDDPDIRLTVTAILESEGYSVAGAANGAEGIKLVQQARPALVLLDMRMPVMDGWAFAERLKELGIIVPVLVMTAAQDARRWAREIRAEGYIAKPFDLIELLAAVEKLMPVT